MWEKKLLLTDNRKKSEKKNLFKISLIYLKKVGFNWWAPSLIDYSLRNKQLRTDQIKRVKNLYSILQPIFGVLGIIIPNEFSIYMKKKNPKKYQNIDCFIFALGFLMSSLFLYGCLAGNDTMNAYSDFSLYMITILAFNSCWVIQSKIFLDIINPRLRSTANSLIIFVLHLLGDDISPYWSGLVADICLAQFPSIRRNTITILVYCTEMSLYPFVLLSFLAAALALLMSLTFSTDHEESKKNSLSV